jgi:hypothetical protein
MNLGSQLVAPNGYGMLTCSETYYLIANLAKSARVLLATFRRREGTVGRRKVKEVRWIGDIIVMNQDFFEQGLAGRKIVLADTQFHHPPWNREYEGQTPEDIDSRHPNKKVSHIKRIDTRRSQLQPLLDRVEELLDEPNPATAINRAARAHNLNPERSRTWLISHLCFRGTSFALFGHPHNAGRYSRLGVARKLGRHSRTKGAEHGYPMTSDMAALCITGYTNHQKAGVTKSEVYRRTLREEFHVRRVRRGGHSTFPVQPEGKPFPSQHQFWRVIEKHFPVEEMQRAAFGDARYRTELQPSCGKFSQSLTNFMEKVTADAYSVEESPRGFLDNNPLPSLWVARAIDGATGAVIGIGFSLGAESSVAYRMMMFSMAIPKKRFCELFGISIAEDEWLGEGHPPMFGRDRGPGAAQSLDARIADVFAIKEVQPAYSGQSNASAEASHPRSRRLEGAPSHLQSAMNPIELCRREIRDAIKHNGASDVRERMTPEMKAWSNANRKPRTPHSITEFLLERGRTSAVAMPFDVAVRTFLTRVSLQAREDGIYLAGQRYVSSNLDELPLLRRALREGRINLSGYALDMCVRHIWIEINGKVIELDAQLSLNDNDDQLSISLQELRDLDDAFNGRNAEDREQREGWKAYTDQACEDEIGKKWNAGGRRRGKKKGKSRKSATEAKEANSFTSKGRA